MDDAAARMIDFISRDLLGGRAGTVTADTPLVSSGLIDSLAQVEVVAKLEEVTGKRLGPGSISPEDLETVTRMLEVVRRR